MRDLQGKTDDGLEMTVDEDQNLDLNLNPDIRDLVLGHGNAILMSMWTMLDHETVAEVEVDRDLGVGEGRNLNQGAITPVQGGHEGGDHEVGHGQLV